MWNWQKKNWGNFNWDAASLKSLEEEFLYQSGLMVGVTKHFSESEKQKLVVEILSDEAVSTSQIEGEYLNRESVQSSISYNFGFSTDRSKNRPAERAIAAMMSDLYQNFNKKLDHETLYRWHQMLTENRQDLTSIGAYRTHKEPMQVVSGHIGKTKVHFQAPPSSQVLTEMNNFLAWWHNSAREDSAKLTPLSRCGIAHLYFVCIHPFEDGNGRIARALAEKSLAESLGEATLIAISQTIQKNRKAYYAALEHNNKDNDITSWLYYHGQLIIAALKHTLELLEFIIEKNRFLSKYADLLNLRQEKVLKLMLAEGLSGFKGGLSAENYIKIAGTSRATATRDLNDLVNKNALTKTGELKGTRYFLGINI
jgi:Fic family protein